VLFVDRSAEVYDVGSGTFAPTEGAMIMGRSGAAAESLPNGTVLIAGGISQFWCVFYDPVVDSFSAGPVTFARFGLSAITLADGSVLLAGGGPIAAQIYK
jgi:hypothetical protein